MSHLTANFTAPNMQPQSAQLNHASGLHDRADTNQHTTHAPQGAIKPQCAGQGATQSQSLTERNLVEHNRQQKKHNSLTEHNGISSDEYFAKLHQEHTARIYAVGQSLGIDQPEILVERNMQNSQAATPMEWYLAEDKRRRPN